MQLLSTIIICLLAQTVATEETLEVSATSTIETSTISEPVVVESDGVLNLLNMEELNASNFHVDNSGQFLFKSNVRSEVDIGYLNNSGYILLDTIEADRAYLHLGNNTENNGELVVYGQHLNVHMDSVENSGSITVWGYAGEVTMEQFTNKKDVCFHEQLVELKQSKGAGCFAVSNSSVYISNPDEFHPTIVLEDSQNHVYLEEISEDLVINLVNFQNVVRVTAPNDGYENFSYTNGSLILAYEDFRITLEIGSGYDSERISVENDDSGVLVSYDGSAPSKTSHETECGCALETDPPVKEAESSTVEAEDESSSTNDDDNGKGNGNQNSRNSSASVLTPIYLVGLSFVVSLMIML
ncbi:uncharacterized protein SPAPADRAFT_62340 [Spathaspora passalidarum NRRL Y-27907]|uniref:Hyphally-regulated cell wall protein N-terminal domain-containing protein n=1 Tax=Spathaspora passalidarum (strain NRRL Y-27907 / 11-Y1) TaxID=619300 RepID=G3ARD9_SPAPN|nr:uncharacterized protein SPAPADRAFT_62340 [Spathaspora passalidarum NRRL Y-27907]EGW31746.1 hypothetical protein SPAPADRAFT_62340 [Spathaspora passalidarum NRRL Y-27907]